MSDIPDDIMIDACHIRDGLFATASQDDRQSVANAIARAILAERKRIANELFHRDGFMTLSSDFTGDYVKISFRSMKDAQDFHAAMVGLSQFSDHSKGAT